MLLILAQMRNEVTYLHPGSTASSVMSLSWHCQEGKELSYTAWSWMSRKEPNKKLIQSSFRNDYGGKIHSQYLRWWQCMPSSIMNKRGWTFILPKVPGCFVHLSTSWAIIWMRNTCFSFLHPSHGVTEVLWPSQIEARNNKTHCPNSLDQGITSPVHHRAPMRGIGA